MSSADQNAQKFSTKENIKNANPLQIVTVLGICTIILLGHFHFALSMVLRAQGYSLQLSLPLQLHVQDML